jgi:hypothetical protein
LAAAVPDRADTIRASRDGRLLFGITNGTQSAWRVEMATETLTGVALPATASRLDCMMSGGGYLISAEPDEPAWVFMGEEPQPRVLFAARPTQAAEGGVQ